MKIFIAVLSFAIAVNAIPLNVNEVEPEWHLVPDGDGVMHYIDINAAYEQPEVFFNAPNDVIFRLFTNSNPSYPHVIEFNNAASVHNSHFNPNHPTRIIIHGWNNNGGSPVNTIIRQAYINHASPFNIITVDWGVGANNINYAASRLAINDVAAHAANFIDWMSISHGLDLGTISIIGHSLGGHTAGLIGKRVTRGRIAVVNAMDPAGPLFFFDRPTERVAPTDADYVEIIYTNAGLLGFDLPIGDGNFFPNGGRVQPGCGIDIVGNCAHSRAFEYYAESINPARRFVSTLCENHDQILNNNCVSAGPQQLMGGEPASIEANGVYHVVTNNASPFARG